ncbi:MAG: DUF5518 domain-containing protein [Haloferacaceae archaeon]
MATINWRAVGYGFLTTLVLGLLSGFTVPVANVTLPAVGYGLAGIIGGGVAGYMVGGKLGTGAIHGGIATVVGGFVVLVVVTLLTTLVSPIAGVGLFGAGVLLLLVQAVPGVIGGAIGSMLKGRQPAEMGRPAA